ncbi:MAG: recombinase family protein, partial [Thermoleophilia bacterium]
MNHINGFYQEYRDDIFEEHEANQYIEDDEDYWEATDAFYERYSDRFVNDYAATNPGEDIAESCTQFILKDRPRGSSIKDQKVEFFYEYPEL